MSVVEIIGLVFLGLILLALSIRFGFFGFFIEIVLSILTGSSGSSSSGSSFGGGDTGGGGSNDDW